MANDEEWSEFAQAHTDVAPPGSSPFDKSHWPPGFPVKADPEPCAECGQEIDSDLFQTWFDCPVCDGDNGELFCSPECWHVYHGAIDAINVDTGEVVRMSKCSWIEAGQPKQTPGKGA